MSTYVEYVSYRANGVPEDTLMELRRGAIIAVKARFADLVAVPCTGKLDDGSWLDVWIYTSRNAAEIANARLGDSAEFMDFYSHLQNVSVKSGVMPDSAASPL